jgi:hypothetical protein
VKPRAFTGQIRPKLMEGMNTMEGMQVIMGRGSGGSSIMQNYHHYAAGGQMTTEPPSEIMMRELDEDSVIDMK